MSAESGGDNEASSDAKEDAVSEKDDPSVHMEQISKKASVEEISASEYSDDSSDPRLYEQEVAYFVCKPELVLRRVRGRKKRCGNERKREEMVLEAIMGEE